MEVARVPDSAGISTKIGASASDLGEEADLRGPEMAVVGHRGTLEQGLPRHTSSRKRQCWVKF